PGMVGGLVLAPVLGLAALAWRSRWSRVREDVRLFFRVMGRRRTRERMAERRRTLVAEFDDVLAAMEKSRQRVSTSLETERQSESAPDDRFITRTPTP